MAKAWTIGLFCCTPSTDVDSTSTDDTITFINNDHVAYRIVWNRATGSPLDQHTGPYLDIPRRSCNPGSGVIVDGRFNLKHNPGDPAKEFPYTLFKKVGPIHVKCPRSSRLAFYSGGGKIIIE